MFNPSATVVGASGFAPCRVKDNAYLFGYHGFVYTALHAVSAETVRHAGVLLLTADRSPVEVTLRDGRCFRASAIAIAPRTARRLRADNAALVSFNVMPSNRWFHVLRELHGHHDVAILDRDGFSPLDTSLGRLFNGEASLGHAERVFDDALGETHRQLPTTVRPDPVAMALLARLDLHPHLGLEELAMACGRSAAWVQRALAQELAMSMRDYQNWLKQRRVFELLYTRRSLTQIALDAGFGDSPQFSRTFQRWYGQSPSYSRNPNHVRVFKPCLSAWGAGEAVAPANDEGVQGP